VLERLALFGAGGDLAGRLLLPALAALHTEDRLTAGFQLVGADIRDWDDDAFRRHVAGRLERHAPDVPARSREAIAAAARYRRADVSDAAAVADVVAAGGAQAVAAYLALPQRAFAPAVRSLAAAGLPAGSRVAIEKPFGEDLDGAVALNRLIADGLPGLATVFRVDHALGMLAVQELAALDASAEDVAEVEVLWEETLGLEGRAAFFDATGALKDVLQNHMLELLAVVVAGAGASRLDALRAVRTPASADMTRRTRRARYRGYAAEDGVDPARGTETFAELLLDVDVPRWAGIRCRLRAGKALAADFKGVVLHRRGSGERRFPCQDEVGAYRRVLLDVLGGGSALAVSGAEAEEAWRIVMPVLDTWAAGAVPLEDYEPGSAGPPRLEPSSANVM
jgi:glucose-6-phosphate 1-dehydrogenase